MVVPDLPRSPRPSKAELHTEVGRILTVVKVKELGSPTAEGVPQDPKAHGASPPLAMEVH